MTSGLRLWSMIVFLVSLQHGKSRVCVGERESVCLYVRVCVSVNILFVFVLLVVMFLQLLLLSLHPLLS